MASIAGTREIYWSVLGIGILPTLLYISDIFGWFVEPSAVWFPVYVIGIIPVIITDLAVSRFLPVFVPLTLMFLFYAVAQLVFALLLAWVSKMLVGTRISEAGEIRVDPSGHRLKRTVRFIVYVYSGLFVIYWIVSVLLAS